MRYLALLLVPMAGCVVGDLDDPDTDAPFDDAPAYGALATTQLTLGGHPARADFANPADGAEDRAIIDEVLRLIDDTQPGGHIRAAIHSLTLPGVTSHLLARTDVTVDVVLDGKNQGNDVPEQLRAGLGAAHVKFCVRGTDHGCITTDASGIMHSKLFTFSSTKVQGATGYRDDVVWIASANMTKATGLASFNNAVTVYGDHELYTAMTGYFGDLWAMQSFAGNDYYEAPRGFTSTPSARVYASPDQTGDLVYNRINDIEPGADCRVRVAENMIHSGRMAVTQRLAYLANHGCDVRVVVHEIDQPSYDVLHAARIPVRSAHVHDKSIISKARFAGSTDARYMVFTGSHNLTTSAGSANDELFVRYESDALYAAFVAHFKAAWAIADRVHGATGAADDE